MACLTRLSALLGFLLLLQQGWVHCSEGRFLQEFNTTEYSASQVAWEKGWAAVHRKLGAFRSCNPTDISVAQGQISGDNIPRFEVRIINTCTDHLCFISNIVVNCGHFSSANFVNPKLFRRLDVNAGTCLANDGRSIQAGQGITFTYDEILRQPMSLKSATVFCSGRWASDRWRCTTPPSQQLRSSTVRRSSRSN